MKNNYGIQGALHDHLKTVSYYLLVEDKTACPSDHCVRMFDII